MENESAKSVTDNIANGMYTLSGQRKGRSFIWNILTEIVKPDNSTLKEFVFCRTCRNVLKYNASQTSNLNRHSCCKNLKQSQSLKTVKPLDKTETIEKCANWITEDWRPFSTVRGSGFVKLVKFFIKIGATYGEHDDVEDMLPDHTTISRKVTKCANDKKEELKAEINKIVSSGGASATIDMWLDNFVKRNFLGVTFHYQKDFKFWE
uniref:Transposable element Hobo transposase n=1 Tax=Bactrocera dorsalis TaxID=27457 RepID=A0A034WLQ6_BACDO